MTSNSQIHCDIIMPQKLQQDIQQNYEQDFEQKSENKLEQNLAPAITAHEVPSSTSIQGQNNFENQRPKYQSQAISQSQQNQKLEESKKHPKEQSLKQENIQPNLSKTSINGDMQYPQFQVVIHKVSSKQSLHQNNDQFQIQFTKSELEIPIEVDQDQNQPIQAQTEYVNIWKKEQSQDDDIYVKMLQEKWAKKQSEIKTNEKTQIQQQQPQSFGILNILQQLSKITNQTNLPKKKQEIHKKTCFKIKKVKQDNNRSSSSTLNVKNLKVPNQPNRVLSNKSQFINHRKQKSLVQLNRFTKKNLSNFQSVKDSPAKTKITPKKSEQNIHYQIVLGNHLETMNQILQDKTYNTILSPIRTKQNQSNLTILKEQTLEDIKNSQMPIKTVRKIIKRSPYGILQIEVKDSKNNAKITNLRILKPKQMLRLKKIPKVVKILKQNIGQ